MFKDKSSVVFTVSAYRNDPKFSDRYAWANSADPEQSDHSEETEYLHLYRYEPIFTIRLNREI